MAAGAQQVLAAMRAKPANPPAAARHTERSEKQEQNSWARPDRARPPSSCAPTAGSAWRICAPFGHRSRIKQMGYGPEDYAGKPVIAIVNTWSDIQQCHAHFKVRVEDVKRGVLQAGGFPLELPAISLSGPSSSHHHALPQLLAMETEELLRSHPIDAAVLMGAATRPRQA